jgi:uncharacterized protein
MASLSKAVLVILIIGGINWLLIGLFNVDLVARLFGSGSPVARLVYIVVGLCALYCLSLLFTPRVQLREVHPAAH